MKFSQLTFLAGLSFLAGPVALAAAPAQTGAPGCSAIVADHSTINGTDAVAGTAIFSGELLQTQSDGQLMIQCGTVRLGLASGGSMRVFQTGAATDVELERGTVAYSTGGQSEDVRFYALDVKVVPDTRQATVGQVDVVSDCELSVQSSKGTATVTSDKETKTVEESKAYDVSPKLGVDYSDDWRPVPADYPDFPRDAKYHESHHHIACAAAVVKTPMTLGPEEFKAIVAAGVMTGGGIAVWQIATESPSKPSSH
jgi:hypothetical protein